MAYVIIQSNDSDECTEEHYYEFDAGNIEMVRKIEDMLSMKKRLPQLAKEKIGKIIGTMTGNSPDGE